MAKTENTLTRRRGRPKTDRQAQIDEALILWIERGGAGEHGLQHAVQIVIPRGPPNARGNYHHQYQREALHRALRDLWLDERIERATRLARERGIAIPRWAEEELEAARARKREWAAALPGLQERMEKQEPAFLAKSGLLTVAFPDLHLYEHWRRMGKFCIALDGLISPNTPISVVAHAFAGAVRQVQSEGWEAEPSKNDGYVTHIREN